MTERRPVIVDSNSIIYVVKNHINLDMALRSLSPELYPVLPECVLRELRGLSKGNVYAKTALAIFSSVEVIGTEGRGDQCIIDLARKTGWAVLTNDRELTGQLRKFGIRVYLVKERRYIGEAR